MKKATLMAFLLVALAPIMQALAGGDPTTYYAALKAQVSSNSSGYGKVYAGASNTPGTYAESFSQSSNQSSTTQNEEKTFYAFAQANDGYEFIGWSTTENGTTYASTASPYSVKVKCSSSTESSPTLTTVYANFKKKTLAAFGITFETSSAGTYTVDGVAPVNKTGLTEATSVILASSDPNFLNWTINGTEVTANPYTANCTANTTISAVFLTEDQVISATTIDDLTSALSNQAYRKIIVPDNITLTVAKGSTVTVPAGKMLVVDGMLYVEGSLKVSGTVNGQGKVAKHYMTVKQEDTIYEPYDGVKYMKTTTISGSGSITGTVGCKTGWSVKVMRGDYVIAWSGLSDSQPAALVCTVDMSKAVNHITSIDTDFSSFRLAYENARQSDTSNSGPSQSIKGNSKLIVMLKNDTTASVSDDQRYGFMVDCAGCDLAFTATLKSNYDVVILNCPYTGTQYSTAIQLQSMVTNTRVHFFNCKKAGVKINAKNSTIVNCYDCGDLSISYDPSTVQSGEVNIYSGGPYSASYNKLWHVYGGTFKSDPSSYLWDSTNYEVKLVGNNYEVVEKMPTVYVAYTLAGATTNNYESLSEAISKVANGETVFLMQDIELDADLEIDEGRDITIETIGCDISGHRIVNAGVLHLEDSKMTSNPGTISSGIVNSGTITIAYGEYTGSIELKGGTFTVYNGTVDGSITVASSVNDPAAVANLKGGQFATRSFSHGSEIKDISTICEAGEEHIVRAKGGRFRVARFPTAVVTDTGAMSLSAVALDETDSALWTRFAGDPTRANFTAADWYRACELQSTFDFYQTQGIDCAILVDRPVAAGTLSINAPVVGIQSINADILVTEFGFSALLPIIRDYPITPRYSPWAYSTFLPGGEHSSVSFQLINNDSANYGTLIIVQMRLASDIQSSSGKKDYSYTQYDVIGSRRYVIGAGSNVAMIRPEVGAATFYPTLAAAVNAVTDGGTIMLSNDCSDNVAVGKACTIDTNGFAFSGEITLAEAAVGYSISESDGVYVVKAPDPTEQINVETVVSQVVSTEWLEANEIDIENKTEEEIQAAVQEVLAQPDDNGNAKWQNLVLGQEADKPVEVKAPVEKGTKTTATIAVSFEVPKDENGDAIDTGYTVKYAFDKTDSKGTVEGEAQENPTIDFTKVEANEPTYFTMRAVLEAKDDTNVTVDVPVEKTIGVVKVASEAEVTILPVPWQSLGDGDIKASELVHAASLSDDDELIVYGADGKPQTWVVKNGEWTAPVAEYTIGGGDSESQQEEAQDPAELKRGQGVILKRKDTSKEIVLIGQPADSEAELETPIAAAADDEPSWNLVASPKMEAVAVADVASSNTSDEIIVPTAGTPKHYTYKNGEWGYPGADSVDEIQRGNKTIRIVTSTHKTDDNTVPAGMGFWYLNKSADEDKKISW